MRMLLIMCVGVLASSCAQDGGELTLQHVLDKNAEARGGKTALESVNNIKLGVDVTEPEFSVSGAYIASRDGYMRVDIYMDGQRVFTEGLDEEGGWQMADDGVVKAQSEVGAAILERGRIGNLYGLHEFAKHGYSLALNGIIERHGKGVIDISVLAPGEFSMHYFLDPETYLTVSRIETSALHPDLDDTEVWQETFYLEYSETDGVLFPRRTEKRNIDTGEVMQSTITTSLEVNVELATSDFNRP